MKAPELSRKYATAVFSLALDEWLKPLNQVRNALAKDSALMLNLEDPNRAFNDRQQALDKVIPPESSKQVRNFLYTLLKEGDINLLNEVLEDLERIVRGGPVVRVARITTALSLSEAEKDAFRQKLTAQYGEGLDFVFNLDPSILGGAIVQVGDKVIDGSVATRLASMSNVLGVK